MRPRLALGLCRRPGVFGVLLLLLVRHLPSVIQFLPPAIRRVLAQVDLQRPFVRVGVERDKIVSFHSSQTLEDSAPTAESPSRAEVLFVLLHDLAFLDFGVFVFVRVLGPLGDVHREDEVVLSLDGTVGFVVIPGGRSGLAFVLCF